MISVERIPLTQEEMTRIADLVSGEDMRFLLKHVSTLQNEALIEAARAGVSGEDEHPIAARASLAKFREVLALIHFEETLKRLLNLKHKIIIHE